MHPSPQSCNLIYFEFLKWSCSACFSYLAHKNQVVVEDLTAPPALFNRTNSPCWLGISRNSIQERVGELKTWDVYARWQDKQHRDNRHQPPVQPKKTQSHSLLLRKSYLPTSVESKWQWNQHEGSLGSRRTHLKSKVETLITDLPHYRFSHVQRSNITYLGWVHYSAHSQSQKDCKNPQVSAQSPVAVTPKVVLPLSNNKPDTDMTDT